MEKLKQNYTLYRTLGLKCDGCNLGKDYYSDGYRCLQSGHFFHKECANSDSMIHNLYHPQHPLHIKVVTENKDVQRECKLCRGNLPKMYYNCLICDFSIDLICAKKEVVITIECQKTHEHRLSLVPKIVMFTCHLCGLLDDRFPYTCNLCTLSFHKDCAESTPDLNYSCHGKHLLKRLTRVPSYTNGKCCFCGNKLHNVFYHCSICNFSVDVDCAKNPPPVTLFQPKGHEHSLTLMPQRSFVCNACGMDDDRNPYVCLQCNFMIHRNCIDMPHIIKIYRHDHRIYYKQNLDAGDWKCGVCHEEINWTCGAYSCLKCSGFAVHSRCATKFGIWDGIELEEGIPENILEVKSYEVIEEGVIKHFSHAYHTLKLKEDTDINYECMWCKACAYPILSSTFYRCMECDDFILHKKCAHLPKKKFNSFYKMLTTLITDYDSLCMCNACQNICQGFWYISDNGDIVNCVRCGSISEPFVHESHPLHMLYINYSTEDMFCNACGDKATMMWRCEECEFVLDIKCSILPKMVKHKYDKDHFLSLCYGEKTSEQYWCEICEEKLTPEKWFYLCHLCGITFHVKCTLGDFLWIKPAGEAESSKSYAILNKHITRPVCYSCSFRCLFPSFLNFHGDALCSMQCLQKMYIKISMNMFTEVEL